jgi:hypothetical protein
MPLHFTPPLLVLYPRLFPSLRLFPSFLQIKSERGREERPSNAALQLLRLHLRSRRQAPAVRRLVQAPHHGGGLRGDNCADAQCSDGDASRGHNNEPSAVSAPAGAAVAGEGQDPEPGADGRGLWARAGAEPGAPRRGAGVHPRGGVVPPVPRAPVQGPGPRLRHVPVRADRQRPRRPPPRVRLPLRGPGRAGVGAPARGDQVPARAGLQRPRPAPPRAHLPPPPGLPGQPRAGAAGPDPPRLQRGAHPGAEAGVPGRARHVPRRRRRHGAAVPGALHLQHRAELPAQVRVPGGRHGRRRRGRQGLPAVLRLQPREADRAAPPRRGGRRRRAAASGHAQGHRRGVQGDARQGAGAARAGSDDGLIDRGASTAVCT